MTLEDDLLRVWTQAEVLELVPRSGGLSVHEVSETETSCYSNGGSGVGEATINPSRRKALTVELLIAA